jgi:Ser/Thr protein kinase RdoA (MazF antagonist)
MQGSLGEKFGEGAFADVHAWAPGRVVKLHKAGIPQAINWWEARMTRAAFAAGAPAPEVFGEVTVDERFGVVLQRFDGPTLLQRVQAGDMTRQQAGTILATLGLAVQRTPPPKDVLSLRAAIEATLRFNDRGLPKHIATSILALIERLSPGDGLCHCDIHPGNVILTAEGPRLIDWGGAVRAPGWLDLATCHLIMSEIGPEVAGHPGPRATAAAMLSEYARLADLSPATLTTAIAPYLPIARFRFLLGGAVPAFRERLIQRVEAELSAAGALQREHSQSP